MGERLTRAARWLGLIVDDDEQPVTPYVVFPHSDPRILHQPGTCMDCDEHPKLQWLREVQQVCFTGETDPFKAPCPSIWARSLESIEAYEGNRAHPAPRSLR